jgi:hypothetical protein
MYFYACVLHHYLLVPNIVLINIFPGDRLWPGLMVRGQFSHLYKETGNIITLCMVFYSLWCQVEDMEKKDDEWKDWPKNFLVTFMLLRSVWYYFTTNLLLFSCYRWSSTKRSNSHYEAWPSAAFCLFLLSLQSDNSKYLLQCLAKFRNNALTL